MRSMTAIVEELSCENDDDVRKHTCMALSALGGDYGLAKLVNLALSDRSDAVRHAAADEIARLPDGDCTRLIARLHEALDDPARRAAAYDALCRIAAVRVDASEKGNRMPTRLMRYWRTKKLRMARKDVPQFDALKSCFFGAVLGFLLLFGLSTLLTYGEQRDSTFDLILFFMSLAVFVFTYGMLYRSGPLGVHFDRKAEVVGEVIGAGVRAILAASAILFIFIVGQMLTGEMRWDLDVLAAFCIVVGPAVVVAVASQIGALVGVQFFAAGPLRRVVGLVAGISLAVCAVTAGIEGIHRSGLATEDSGSDSVFWIISCIVAICASYTLVSREIFYNPPRQTPKKLWWIVSATATLLLVAALGDLTLQNIMYNFVEHQSLDISQGMGSSSWMVFELKEKEIVDLNAKEPMCLRFAVVSLRSKSESLTGLVATSGGQVIATTEKESNTAKKSVEGGAYKVAVVRHVESSHDHLYASVTRYGLRTVAPTELFSELRSDLLGIPDGGGDATVARVTIDRLPPSECTNK